VQPRDEVFYRVLIGFELVLDFGDLVIGQSELFLCSFEQLTPKMSRACGPLDGIRIEDDESADGKPDGHYCNQQF